MPNFCKLEISGRIGQAPDLRYTPNGKAVCAFSVAYNPGKKEDNKPTVWFLCKAWGDRAESIAAGLSKGAGIVIKSASPELRKWKDRDGKDRETLEWLVWEWEPSQKKKEAESQSDQPFNPDEDIPF